MGRTTPWAAGTVLCLCLALSASAAFGQSSDAIRRVRAPDPELRGLLDEGIDRSPTFRRLVQGIDATDGIVYVQSGACSIAAAMGCLMLSVQDAGYARYLHIHVAPRRHRHDERITLIGHELQHAAEVLSATWVRDSADAYALFIRIGSAGSIRDFETAEAQRIGAVIAGELAAHPRRSTQAHSGSR
jgi:hypothetical protein